MRMYCYTFAFRQHFKFYLNAKVGMSRRVFYISTGTSIDNRSTIFLIQASTLV